MGKAFAEANLVMMKGRAQNGVELLLSNFHDQENYSKSLKFKKKY